MATEIGPQNVDLNSEFDPEFDAAFADAPGMDSPPDIPAGSQPGAAMESPLGRQLLAEPFTFEFFQAVAHLQRIRDTMRPVGHFSNPESEAIQFRVNQRLAMPASEIQELTLPAPRTTAGEESPIERPAQMTVNFMGLTGPSGVLPYTYSELILERARAKDYSLASFLDIFNHRAISLFYRAWQKFQFPVTYASSTDHFTHYLLDLVGLGTPGLSDRQQVEDEALLHYVGLIANQARSAEALQQLLADYFEVPVEIQQFTGGWYALSPDTQCKMTDFESPSSQVGSGAVVGDSIWDRQGHVRIRIGPLSMARYTDFLPQGSAYASLRAITRFFSNQCIDFEAQLVLDRTEVPSIELNLDSPAPARLGWVSWARTAPLALDPDDTILAL